MGEWMGIKEAGLAIVSYSSTYNSQKRDSQTCGRKISKRQSVTKRIERRHALLLLFSEPGCKQNKILLTSLSTLANEAPPVDRCRFKGLAPAGLAAPAPAAAVVSGKPVGAVDGAGGTGSGRRRIPKMSPSPSMMTCCTLSTTNCSWLLSLAAWLWLLFPLMNSDSTELPGSCKSSSSFWRGRILSSPDQAGSALSTQQLTFFAASFCEAATK